MANFYPKVISNRIVDKINEIGAEYAEKGYYLEKVVITRTRAKVTFASDLTTKKVEINLKLLPLLADD